MSAPVVSAAASPEEALPPAIAEAAFEASPDACVIVDAEGTVLSRNASARGLEQRGIALPPTDTARWTTLIQRALRSTTPIPGRLDAAPSDSQPLVGTVRCHAVRLPAAGPPRVLVRVPADAESASASPFRRLNAQYEAMQRELRRRLAEVERERALESRLFERQKLESLGLLAGGVAHDFNNLLMGVLGHANLALTELPPQSGARESVRHIEESARRAAELTRQLLAYAGRGRFVVETLDVSRLVADMLHLLEVTLSRKAILQTDLPDGLPLVRGDATQLRQIVMNLVTNASDAIGGRSGFVAVHTGAVTVDEEYLTQLALGDELRPGTYVTLEVRDTGEGMDEARKARIFDPFFTTKENGHGLGLAAVLGIVRRHAGAIRIYSEPGRGTTFRLYFPVADAGATADAIVTVSAPDRLGAIRRRGSQRVLLADDNETVRAVLQRALARLSWDITAATNGTEALAAYRGAREPFDIVLLDMMMPGLTGAEVLSELARFDPNARVILMSGHSEHEVQARVPGRRLAGYLHKPFSIDELYEVLDRALARAADGDG